ncbi:hypothetical protein HDU83_001913 [Entophlyctis luteolus]|nr:hypothetical protein HDU82_008137 [Entophlyctis luteolus]KAJ3347647.1 hypothetical protein HDU83_001913 [Entophlyctis luteolus]
MRLSFLPLLFLLAAALSVTALQKLTPEDIEDRAKAADAEIWHLGKDNFEERLSHGNWLVFYGTTWCKFCKRLTPRWLKMQTEFVNQKLHEAGFLITKVDCTGSNEEVFTIGWCASKFDVVAYPTVNLYHNGKLVEEYMGDHEVDAILSYIKEKINFYRG